jgi:hypothetical protein
MNISLFVYILKEPHEDQTELKQLLLITNAQISSLSSLLSIVSANAEFFTIFPLGIGPNTNYFVVSVKKELNLVVTFSNKSFQRK